MEIIIIFGKTKFKTCCSVESIFVQLVDAAERGLPVEAVLRVRVCGSEAEDLRRDLMRKDFGERINVLNKLKMC